MKVIENSDCLLKLLEALERGWEIDQPVLFGSMWHPCPGTKGNVYHIVLRNKKEGKTILLSLSASPELRTFLAEGKIQVKSL